jgi:hypothetical protein
MRRHLVLEQEGELTAVADAVEMAVHLVILAAQPATLLPLGEISKAVGGTALRLLVLLDVPGQFGGDVGDKVAAWPQTVVVAPHSELAVLVGTETLERVVGELVTDIDQVVVGVYVVQAVGFGLAGSLAHILAVPKQAVEVELVGVLAVRGQTGIIFLELQEARFDLWLGVLQRGGGQGGVGR